MKNSMVPPDAFALYVGMGQDRTYEAVAKHYGLCKRTILRAAIRDRWQQRLEDIEREAQAATDAKLAKAMLDMNMRHRKLLLGIASRAAQALSQFELKSAMEAVRAAEVAVKLERLLAGEATETKTLSIEQVSRDEVSRFLVAENEADDWGDEERIDTLEGEDERDDGTTLEERVV